MMFCGELSPWSPRSRDLDLGAVSTRPRPPVVSEEEELRRLLPSLDAVLREGFGAVSVDTFRPAVAHAALRAGASMINDVYGARQPGMLKVLGEHKPWVCVMHMKGSPQTMQKGAIAYEDVVEQVAAWLDESAGAVVAAGVPQDCVLVDPGIGFGKTDAHNLALTLGCQRLASRTGCAVLYGASRKSIIGRLAAVDAPKKRLPGSLSLSATGKAMRVMRRTTMRSHNDAGSQPLRISKSCIEIGSSGQRRDTTRR